MSPDSMHDGRRGTPMPVAGKSLDIAFKQPDPIERVVVAGEKLEKYRVELLTPAGWQPVTAQVQSAAEKVPLDSTLELDTYRFDAVEAQRVGCWTCSSPACSTRWMPAA
jgi:hypothetical protein